MFQTQSFKNKEKHTGFWQKALHVVVSNAEHPGKSPINYPTAIKHGWLGNPRTKQASMSRR
jgi:hypothetical protein